MIVIRLPTPSVSCAIRGSKFEVRGSKFRKPRTSDIEPLPVPHFLPFVLFSPWEPGYEQTD